MRAYLVQKSPVGEVTAAVQTVERPGVAEGEIVIRVAYSSLNFKDALAATANPAVAKKLPHVPGIDLAGAVTESKSERFEVGDQVVAIGYELGVERWGGWATECAIPAKFAVPMPAELDPRTAMILGTAGWTAMDCVLSLEERGVTPDKGEVIVTGAGGGVGRLAVMLLAQRGYKVVAVTGRAELVADLHAAGASRVLSRTEIDAVASPKPLLAAKWAGLVDVVGGATLAHLLKEIEPHGAAAICGLVGGVVLNTTVHPFILRGVSLIGVDSAWPSLERREAVWRETATLTTTALESIAREVKLEDIGAEVEKILKGQVAGRVLVKLST
jgi:acrylyl-CoA reductase (NADPH)